MGQGIKGMIVTKGKIAIVIMLALFIFSIFFLSNPRDNGISGNIAGNTDSRQLEKSVQGDHYYISFIRYQGDKKAIKLECTKKQYDYMSGNDKEYHIFFRLNFFNKYKGKILEVDDKPIMHGDYNVALYNSFKIVQ